MGQRPGFRVEDGALIFLVIVRGGGIYGEQDGQRQQFVLAQQQQIRLTGLPQGDIFLVDVGVLIKLGQPFVHPQGHPLGSFAQKKVHVLVINHCIGMIALGVQAHENVVLVGRAQKKST